jgi:glucokinase-like ROK family protein
MKVNKTWNQHVVKVENKSLVLEKIIEHSPISRADIAGITGLNKGTVSSLVNELILENLINESGPGKSSGGRRPVMLHFNQLAGYSIGIDLGVNYILGVLTDLNGNICVEKQSEFSLSTYEDILSELFSIIDSLVAAAPKCPYGIVGIGIGVPGIVNKESKILLAPNLDWRNVELKPDVEEKYGVPVVIENEANAGAYGEKKFGVGKEFDNIIYVSVGIGIGAGLILNGKLYRGNNGFSGELGHMTIDVNGPKCSCGNRGCWELYASEKFLLNEAQRAGLQVESGRKVSLETIMEMARSGDAQALEVLSKTGRFLGVGINNIIHTFNPDQVIVGNRIAEAKTWLNPPIHQWIENQSLWFSQKDLQINFSGLLTHSAALGVAAFSTEKFINRSLSAEAAAL